MTSQVFDVSTSPAKDLALLPTTAFEDLAVADFNNDGQLDLFMARKNPAREIAFGHPSANELIADINLGKQSSEQIIGFTFEAKPPIEVEIASAWPRETLTRERILLGSAGANPADFKFTISDDTGGIAAPPSGHAPAVTISRLDGNRWQVRATATSGDNPKPQQTQLKLRAPGPVELIDTLGATPSDENAPSRLFIYRDGAFHDESDDRDTNERLVAGSNVVAADFDNDMDVDLFVLASGLVGNQQNLLLLNRGDGHFDIAAAAGGAAGSLHGVGDSVTSADIDNDGFVDLLIANGGSMGRSLGLPSDNGGYQLFRNFGNQNHWLKIELEGVKSNRDGIGAVVQVTAAGVTQTRIQNNGVHNNGQDHQVLHFGLGQAAQIDELKIWWPSGTQQVIKQLNRNQLLKIKEASADQD